jgi:hypothetical protein
MRPQGPRHRAPNPRGSQYGYGPVSYTEPGDDVLPSYGDGWDGGDCPVDCGPCYRPCFRLWFHGEFLMWWDKTANLPPLLSTSALPFPPAQPTPGRVLFGGEGVDLGIRSGSRVTLGLWTSPAQDSAFEATYLFLSSKAFNFAKENDGGQTMGRPFFNITDEISDLHTIAPNQDGTVPGTFSASLANEFKSLELVMRRAVYQDQGRRLDLLFGYRYARFAESLNIADTSFDAFNDRAQVRDQFTAGNEFNGAELGFSAQTQHFRWSLEFLAKLALGGTRSRVRVFGDTLITPGGTTPQLGGLLALPSNMGTYSQNNFTMIPELGATIGCDLTSRVKATFGYSLIYWSKVARAGDQIDLNVNTTQFPTATGPGALAGVPSPLFRFATNDYWAQGLNFGLDCRF